MPLNVQMRNAIIDHADLLHDSDGMPNSFLDLCAHVAGYETVLEPWRSGNFDPSDYRDNTSVVKFPAAELGGYVHDAYHELRLEQETLLQGLGLAGRR